MANSVVLHSKFLEALVLFEILDHGIDTVTAESVPRNVQKFKLRVSHIRK